MHAIFQLLVRLGVGEFNKSLDIVEFMIRFDMIWVGVGEGKETFDLVEVLVRFD